MSQQTSVESPQQNLVDYTARAFVFNTLTLPTVEIKGIFTELSALLKKTQLSKAVTLRYKNGSMEVIGAANIVYRALPVVLSQENTDAFEVSFIFKDISSLLPDEGVLRVELTHNHVKFFSDNTHYTFAVEDALVPSIPDVDDRVVGEIIETKNLRESIRLIAKILPLASIYKKSATYLFSGDFVQVRLPSVWVETPNTGLQLTLSTELTSLLYAFFDRAKTVEVMQNESWSLIKKDMSYLYVPVSPVGDVLKVEEVLPALMPVTEVNIKGLNDKIKILTRTMGKAEAEVFVGEEGIRVSVETDSSSIEYSSSNNLGNLLDKFKIRLEFLNAILDTVGSEFYLSKHDIYRCISTDKIKIVITTG